MNVFDNTLEKHENMFITYDTIFLFKEIWLYENIIQPKFDYYKQYLNIAPLEGLCRLALIRIFLERKEKDFIKWLAKDKESLLKMVDELGKYKYTLKNSMPTDFGRGILNLMLNGSVRKLTISMDNNDVQALTVLNDLFGNYSGDRVFIVDNSPSTIVNYIKNKSYTLIATDELDVIKDHMSDLEGKTLCIPYTGYNFDIVDENRFEEPLMISKGLWEFNSIEYKFNIGFVEVYKIVDEMFHMG